jgi:hypothetical protein
MYMIHVITYHTEDMSISAERCRLSALRHGADKVWVWTRAAIEQTDFYESNREILDTPRGSGLWAWKPFIILEVLRMCGPNDTVVYMDAGVECVASLKTITNQMGNIWLFGNMYQHQHWCKGDIMANIGCYPDGKQCQASVIFVRSDARYFIEEWLATCLVPGLIDDSPSKTPNHPEFQENRHDQAILTTLAYKSGVVLHWWPAMYNDGAFTYQKDAYTDNYPVLFLHHRRRNNEY